MIVPITQDDRVCSKKLYRVDASLTRKSEIPLVFLPQMRLENANLTRRALLVNSAVALVGTKLSATPSCTLTPEQEEGPYYVDAAMIRGTVTEEKPGVPLQLRIALVDAKRCTPLQDAAIDIWHCDAAGVYSGFTANGGGGWSWTWRASSRWAIRGWTPLPTVAAVALEVLRPVVAGEVPAVVLEL